MHARIRQGALRNWLPLSREAWLGRFPARHHDADTTREPTSGTRVVSGEKLTNFAPMAGAPDIDPAASPPAYWPPAPRPRPEPLGLFQLIKALWHNPIECWAQEHFEKETVKVSLPLGDVVLVNEPDAIRRVLLNNADNY